MANSSLRRTARAAMQTVSNRREPFRRVQILINQKGQQKMYRVIFPYSRNGYVLVTPHPDLIKTKIERQNSTCHPNAN